MAHSYNWDDWPEMTFAGVIEWMETRRAANGGELSSADRNRANDAWRQLVAKNAPAAAITRPEMTFDGYYKWLNARLSANDGTLTAQDQQTARECWSELATGKIPFSRPGRTR